MKYIFTAIILYFFVNSLYSQELTEISGEISGALAKGKYLATDTLIVPENKSMSIGAGTEIYFPQDIHLLVRGNLNVHGTKEEPVLFSAQDEVWDGINFVEGSSGELRYCIIEKSSNNGVSAVLSNPRFYNCTIRNNSAKNIGGGGFYLLGSNAIIEDCRIEGNSSNYEGGGFYMNSSNPRINRCFIVNNSTELMGGGIFSAMDYNTSSITIRNTVISGNFSQIEGGGLYLTSDATLTNCTIVQNRCSDDYPLSGGGIYADSKTSLRNTVVAYNNAYGLFCDSGEIEVSYCNFYGNEQENYYTCSSDIGNITGQNRNGLDCDNFNNISYNPEFADTTAGNYYILFNSANIDAGNNEYVSGDKDLNNMPRLADGNNSGQEFVDIGAYEYAFPIHADFSADTTSGISYLTVTFQDNSSSIDKEITSWLWDFGDGHTSEEQNPTHTFMGPGGYNVSLTVSDGDVSDKETKNEIIKVYGAKFIADKTNIGENETISFSNNSYGDYTCWLWDFGDGTISREQSPHHSYQSAGKYTIELIVSNGVFIDRAKYFEYIIVTKGGSINTETDKRYDIKVMPNPATNDVHIELAITKPGWISIRLTGLDGRIIDELISEYTDSGERSFNFDLNGLPASIYLLEIQMNDRKHVEKIIKY